MVVASRSCSRRRLPRPRDLLRTLAPGLPVGFQDDDAQPRRQAALRGPHPAAPGRRRSGRARPDRRSSSRRAAATGRGRPTSCCSCSPPAAATILLRMTACRCWSTPRFLCRRTQVSTASLLDLTFSIRVFAERSVYADAVVDVCRLPSKYMGICRARRQSLCFLYARFTSCRAAARDPQRSRATSVLLIC